MSRTLFVGFKGKHNSSNILASSLSLQSIMLTNSFSGLRKDFERLAFDFDKVYLFGVDKNLSDSFRIEHYAQKDDRHLAEKYKGNVVLIHIPTWKNFRKEWITGCQLGGIW